MVGLYSCLTTYRKTDSWRSLQALSAGGLSTTLSIGAGRLGIHLDAQRPISTNQVARLMWLCMIQFSNHSDADISSPAADSSIARGPVDPVTVE